MILRDLSQRHPLQTAFSAIVRHPECYCLESQIISGERNLDVRTLLKLV